MTRVPSAEELALFASLAEKHSAYEVRPEGGSGIGTYNEKRIHRILKEFICDDEACFEVKVGGAVADVVFDGTINEIQTGSFFPLAKKVSAYLEKTDMPVRIFYPVISHRQLVRVDAVSGELIRQRMSPKRESPAKILPELIYLSEHLQSERLTFVICSVAAEEHRYSDEIHRYRKSGKYDREIFPTSLEALTVIAAKDDLKELLPAELLQKGEFSATEFSSATKLRGRRAYNALNALISAGALTKEKDGKKAAIFRLI